MRTGRLHGHSRVAKEQVLYYRCSHGRGKCSLPYMREQEVSDRMGELLKDIYVPETVAHTIVDSLQFDSAHAETERQKRVAAIEQRLAALRGRMDQMYKDKLDGKVDGEFWTRKTNDWREQERKLEADLSSLRVQVLAENALTVKRIFELANRRIFCTLQEFDGSRSNAEISAFELRYGRRKSLASL